VNLIARLTPDAIIIVAAADKHIALIVKTIIFSPLALAVSLEVHIGLLLLLTLLKPPRLLS